MRRTVGRVGCALMALALPVTAACSGSNSSAAPTASSTTRTTDTFSGTVSVGGHDLHSFPIATTGVVDVTLTAAAPPTGIMMGVSLGLPGDGACTPLAGGSAQTTAGSTVQLSGVVSPATMCVDVHDIGVQSAPVTYTVTVTHP